MRKLMIVAVLAGVALTSSAYQEKTQTKAKTKAKADACDCKHWPWPDSCNEVCGKLSGKVMSVSPSQITLSTKNGNEQNIAITDQTKVRGDVKEGSTATVLFKNTQEGEVATIVSGHSNSAKSGKKKPE